MTNYTYLNSLHTYALLGIQRATMTDEDKIAETERINTGFKQLLKLVDVPPPTGSGYCKHSKLFNDCVWCM